MTLPPLRLAVDVALDAIAIVVADMLQYLLPLLPLFRLPLGDVLPLPLRYPVAILSLSPFRV